MFAILPEYGSTLLFATVAALVCINGIAAYLCKMKQQRSVERHNRSMNPLAQAVISNVDGHCLYANRQFLRILGKADVRSGELKQDFPWSAELLEALQKKRLKRHVDGLIFPLEIKGESFVFQIDGYSGHFRHQPVWYISFSDITSLYVQQQRQQEQLRAYQSSNDALHTPICRLDLNERILFCNQAWADFIGLRATDLQGKAISDVLSIAESSKYRVSDANEASDVQRQLESWVHFPDGSRRYLEHTINPVVDERDETIGHYHTTHDLTHWHRQQTTLEQEVAQSKATELQLSRQNSLIRTVLSAAIDPIGFINEQGYFIGGNEPFAAMFHCSTEQIRGKHFSELCETQEQIQSYQQQHQEILSEGETIRVEELVYLEDDQPVWYEVVKSAFFDEQTQERGIVYITRDVTERKQTEQQLADAIMQLQELSYVDSLTQVANRRSFDERLRSMWDLHRRDGKELSLLLIDIDCFKQYNDHYGHQQGDEALRACAKLISQSSKRGSDIVARYGGEEFAILLPNTSSAGGEQIAVNLLAQFKHAKIAHATSFVSEHLSVSVGLATMVPEVEQDYGDLVGAADRCLYQAKHDGRARYALTANVELQLPF